MDHNNETILKKMCCTCLSDDRKLFQLCRVRDGVNNLYWLLSYDWEAYREGFHKNSASLHICWECKAIMSRICSFRRQACDAQKTLANLTEGRCKAIKVLSKLTHTLKETFDNTFIYADTEVAIDNFIDCGHIDLKAESDLDDIPLSELHNNYISDNDTDIVIQSLQQKLKSTNLNSKKVKKKCKLEMGVTENCILSNCNKEYYSTVEMNEVEMLESRCAKKLAASYVEAEFKCDSCVEGYKIQSELDRHNLQMHTEGQNKSPSIMKPGSKPRRNKAMNDKRTPLGFLCVECGKYFDSKKSRWVHVQRDHREGFPCSTCGKRFPFRNNLTRHELTHSSPPPREQCATCKKQVRADLMRAHARTHAQRERVACLHCEKRFASRASYEHHLKYTQVHAAVDVLKYKCSTCDKGYKSKGELRDHINYQHMGKTQHQCPICGKALATRRCVTRHVRRTHEGVKENERDKICQQCGKAFRDKKGLREHELIHTGERPLSCEICGCTFRQNATLYTHKKRVHKIYPKKKQVELIESEITNTWKKTEGVEDLNATSNEKKV
ncbi:zinc finger protein 782-like [Battus philenor]|uniref:zinc finger protein 782-like n=1 Tax=Battus philenor TaxID=42288 RepID=UPI0035D0F1C5